jgi:hypothetical protein
MPAILVSIYFTSQEMKGLLPVRLLDLAMPHHKKVNHGQSQSFVHQHFYYRSTPLVK